MGLRVSIYKAYNGDGTNGGVSSEYRTLTITNIEGPHEVKGSYPAAKLVAKRININDSLQLRIVPDAVEEEWHMFGGNFGFTDDSRFSDACAELLDLNDFCGAVKIFDRVE